MANRTITGQSSLWQPEHHGRKRVALALTVLLSAAVLLFSPVSSATQTHSTDPSNWAWWKPVGSASLTWGFWKIYDSELRTPSGAFNAGSKEPLALVITYSRDIDAEDLLDATVDQWQHLGFSDAQIASWLPQMEGAWPDVKEGDRLIYVLTPDTGTFYYQPRQGTASRVGTVSNVDAAKAFSEIWLSPQTAYPELRLALIGGK